MRGRRVVSAREAWDLAIDRVVIGSGLLDAFVGPFLLLDAWFWYWALGVPE